MKIAIIGHFGKKKQLNNGQTIKTKILATTLEQEFGQESIIKVDTHGKLNTLSRIIFVLVKAFIQCDVAIMLPAQKGVLFLAPTFVILGNILRRKIHYIVIGGWLPEKTKQKKWLAYFLKKFNCIYVETSSMKIALEQQYFQNIFVMPNFKNLKILKENELIYITQAPFPFCTFSRVSKEKGIEDAVETIIQLNKQHNKTIATLDIYGQIDDNYKERFEQLQNNFPSYIQYKGIVNPTESVNTLKNYFALLFPTYYSGEGFAGTLLDAMSAGIPTIASDWKYNKEIVIEGRNGIIISSNSSLLNELKKAIEKPVNFNSMKKLCLQEAKKYTPQNAINILLEHLK